MATLAAAILASAAPVFAQENVPRVKVVYVSAVDRNDVPVTDLSAADFLLKEGGRTREIVKAQRATALMHIVIIVDDSGTGIFRYPISSFIDRLLGHAQFAIKRIVGQAQTIVDYTGDVERLRTAVMSLGARSETPKGGLVVEAVFEAAVELNRGAMDRPVILVFTDTDAEYSTLPAQHVLDELQRSGARLYVVSVIKKPVWHSAGAGVAPAEDKPSDLLDRQVDVNRVLGDGPKQSGGRLVEIAGLNGPIGELQEIAEELDHQYVLTYIVPAGEKADQKISVSVKRRGVSARTPARNN